MATLSNDAYAEIAALQAKNKALEEKLAAANGLTEVGWQWFDGGVTNTWLDGSDYWDTRTSFAQKDARHRTTYAFTENPTHVIVPTEELASLRNGFSDNELVGLFYKNRGNDRMSITQFRLAAQWLQQLKAAKEQA